MHSQRWISVLGAAVLFLPAAIFARTQQSSPSPENPPAQTQAQSSSSKTQKSRHGRDFLIKGTVFTPEGLSFARAAGLDPLAVVEVISKGAAQSWQMENRHKTMLAGQFEHGFAVEWMRKDLAICLAEARRNGTSLPVTSLVDQFYADIERMGGLRWDTSSLFARQVAFERGT